MVVKDITEVRDREREREREREVRSDVTGRSKGHLMDRIDRKERHGRSSRRRKRRRKRGGRRRHTKKKIIRERKQIIT